MVYVFGALALLLLYTGIAHTFAPKLLSNKKDDTPVKTKPVAGVLCLLLAPVLGLLAMAFYDIDKHSPDAPEMSEADKTYYDARAYLREVVKASAHDPRSIEFSGWVRFGDKGACGTVRGNNAFGAKVNQGRICAEKTATGFRIVE